MKYIRTKCYELVLFVLYFPLYITDLEISRATPFRLPFERKIEDSFVTVIGVPITILTFNLTVRNYAPAITIRDEWDVFMNHAP